MAALVQHVPTPKKNSVSKQMKEERSHHGGMLMFNDQLLALLEEINVSLNYESLHTRERVETLHLLQVIFLIFIFDVWHGWNYLFLDRHIPGCHLVPLFFPGRASIDLNKDIPIR